MSTLAYSDSGDARHPAALFLHGFMGSAEDWENVTAALEDRYRCVVVDLPGHGSSLGLPEHAYTMEAAAHALLEVLDEAGIGRAALVGYSMGGRLALYLALRHPERCSKLFLESSSPGIEDVAARQARRIADGGRAKRLETGDFDTFLQDWYRQPLFASLAKDKDLFARTIKTRRRNDPSELARSLRGMGTGAMPSLWAELPDLRTPTLAVTGALDEKFVHIARRMQASTAYLKGISVPNAGHHVRLEAHDAYLTLLQQFLEM